MNLNDALELLKENHYVCNAAGHNGFELDYPNVEYYKGQIEIELKKLGYTDVSWFNSEYWTKLVNDLYTGKKDVEDAAEIVANYERQEQEWARQEQEADEINARYGEDGFFR